MELPASLTRIASCRVQVRSGLVSWFKGFAMVVSSMGSPVTAQVERAWAQGRRGLAKGGHSQEIRAAPRPATEPVAALVLVWGRKRSALLGTSAASAVCARRIALEVPVGLRDVSATVATLPTFLA